MTDDRLPDHSRLIYVVIGIVLLIVAIPLILLLILHVLASDVMHCRPVWLNLLAGFMHSILKGAHYPH